MSVLYFILDVKKALRLPPSSFPDSFLEQLQPPAQRGKKRGRSSHGDVDEEPRFTGQESLLRLQEAIKAGKVARLRRRGPESELIDVSESKLFHCMHES
jgi:hypothetical protein